MFLKTICQVVLATVPQTFISILNACNCTPLLVLPSTVSCGICAFTVSVNTKIDEATKKNFLIIMFSSMMRKYNYLHKKYFLPHLHHRLYLLYRTVLQPCIIHGDR